MIRVRTTVVSEPPPEEDRRVLRRCFLGAALAHALLLLLPMPWNGVAAAPEPPPRVVHRMSLVPPPLPPPEDGPVEPQPVDSPTPIPVPEWAVDEPPPDRAPLPTPDLEALAEFPVMLPVGPGPPPPPQPQATDDPVHVLGAVVPPETLFAPQPAYPHAARHLGRPGTVVLQATIDREGRVTDLEVLRGEPFGMTEAALEAVRRWRFRPATLEGRPVAVYYHLTVRFQVR